jgi:hypothetical protein
MEYIVNLSSVKETADNENNPRSIALEISMHSEKYRLSASISKEKSKSPDKSAGTAAYGS